MGYVSRETMTNPSSQKTSVIAVANQKGGVGKTTSAVNLAAGLAMLRQQVLLVDCDAQGNATSGLGLSPRQLDMHLYHILLGAAGAAGIVRHTAMANLDILPSNTDLVGIELDLAGRQDREGVLKKALGGFDNYDFIILDCPPSLGLMTINAFVASNSVLIPLQCEYFALEGLSQLVQTIRLVKHNFNPMLHIEGILLTMYDHRIRLGYQVAMDVRSHFRELVYRVSIPRNVRLSESPSHGQPVFLYDPKSKGAEAYLSLAREFLSRHRRRL